MTRGLPIPGSRFIRDFCTVCGEPMRVVELKKWATCASCGRRRPGRGRCRRGDKDDQEDELWFDDVEKAFENMEEFDDQGTG